MILAADLDDTLIFSARRLAAAGTAAGGPDSPAAVAVEYKEGAPVAYMSAPALAALRELQRRAVFVLSTLRGEEQARRVDFIRDGSCRYLCCQNGLYIYRDGAADQGWARRVARLVAALPLSLEEAAAAAQTLPGVLRLSRRYEYLAVFFVEAAEFAAEPYQALRRELARQGWRLHRQRRKLYLLPLPINKGQALLHICALEGVAAAGFGDSYFDWPLLAACRRRFAPAGSALAAAGTEDGEFAPEEERPVGIEFSRRPLLAGTEEILGRLCATWPE
jgi:hydroxymethylpyrimidine pyrophosphatase-like HAD family hydrolase